MPRALRTARLLLRQFEEADLDAIARLYRDARFMRHLGPLVARDDSWRHMAMLLGHWRLRGYGMWAVEHEGVVPDAICIAKAIANGLPLSALATRRELQERWGKSAHGSTYGGNALATGVKAAMNAHVEPSNAVERPKLQALMDLSRRPAAARTRRSA